jgi:LysM repeat protein
MTPYDGVAATGVEGVDVSYEADQDEFAQVCPYLGLADDADSHATYATEAHRCYRLPTPTRIATGHQDAYCLGEQHVTCPVYLGEGIPRAAPAAAAAAGSGAGPAREAAPKPLAARGGKAPEGNGIGRTVPGPGAGRPRRPATGGPGALSPRPRAGGISMPVATIGLFAMAIIVVGIAFAISRAVGDGDNGTLTAPERFATNVAQTRAAGGSATQPTAEGQATQAPAQATATATPAGNATAPPRTATPGGTARTYTVKAGDNCSVIANQNGITVPALMQANPSINAECTNLAEGQELTLP